MESDEELEFKEGLRQYIILSGKAYGKVLSKEDDEKMSELFMKYGITEEARVQWGAKPSFTDEEYDALFDEGKQLQYK